jgi:esterase/lipase
MFTKLGLNKEAGRLTVMGYSLGSVFATDIAVNNNVGQLILLSPVSDVADMLKHYKRAFLSGVKVVLRPFIDLTAKDYLLAISNLEKIKHFPNKLLIFHAKDDADLPYKMGKKLYENALSEKKQFVSVRKGGHAAAFEHQNLLKVVGWINKGV